MSSRKQKPSFRIGGCSLWSRRIGRVDIDIRLTEYSLRYF